MGFYSLFIHYLSIIYSPFIHCLSIIYPLFIHFLVTTYPLLIHNLFTIYLLFIHNLFTVYPLLIHYLLTTYSLLTHYLFTIYSLFIHHLPTIIAPKIKAAKPQEVALQPLRTQLSDQRCNKFKETNPRFCCCLQICFSESCWFTTAKGSCSLPFNPITAQPAGSGAKPKISNSS